MSTSIDAYRNVNLETANPRQVIIKLLDAGSRFLTEAENQLTVGDSPDESLAKARTVIGGLMTSLDFEAGEMAQQLLRLYLFVLDRIQTAQTERDGAGLQDAVGVLDTLRSGWEGASADEVRKSLEQKRPAGLSLKG